MSENKTGKFKRRFEAMSAEHWATDGDWITSEMIMQVIDEAGLELPTFTEFKEKAIKDNPDILRNVLLPNYAGLISAKIVEWFRSNDK